MDVARKVVILAREAGLRTELADVAVQSLVPEPLAGAPSAEEFLAQLPQVLPACMHATDRGDSCCVAFLACTGDGGQLVNCACMPEAARNGLLRQILRVLFAA